MRGKVEGMHFVGYRDGITPAYAGKRTNVYCKVYLNKDHPRLCGEKRWCKVQSKSKGRITPAYAGKSDPLKLWYIDVRDHPRLCGKKVKALKKSCPDAGSPPPMRGKVILCTPKNKKSGITPAYAGKRCAVNTSDVMP